MAAIDEASLPAVHALHLGEVVARFGIAPAELFDGVTEGGEPLDARTLSDPAKRLPLGTISLLIERARLLTGEPGVGFHLGLQMRVSAHGYLGFAAMSSSTVGEALELAARFAPTRTEALALRLHRAGELASLVIEERVPLGEAADVIIFALMVGISQIGAALTGQSLDGMADVRFKEPDYMPRFTSVFGARIRFNQPSHQLVFDARLLDLPIALADPAALRLARDQCERELERLGEAGSMQARVRAALGKPLGFRSLEETAALLAVSPRTLKRRLADEGKDFSLLLEEERRDRAFLLLRSPETTVDGVADALGYSDTANFTRAFRRWTGTTPTAFRKGPLT